MHGEPQTPSSSLVSDAIGAITRRIREEDLMPGDRLPSETQLSKDLDVSRTVVREAMRSLEAMRIIDLATGKRATVARIDHGAMSLMIEHGVNTEQINIQQIYDVRRTIETRVATLAAIRRSDAEAARDRRDRRRMRRLHGQPARADGGRPRLPRRPGPRLAQSGVRADRRGLPRASPGRPGRSGGRAGRRRKRAKRWWRPTRRSPARCWWATRRRRPAAMAIHFDESVRALLSAGMS